MAGPKIGVYDKDHFTQGPNDLGVIKTVSTFRKNCGDNTGLGPEGLQLLVVTHPHLQQALNGRQLPCLAFADYDVAPHGFHDFYDVVRMFCSNNTLGLGIGNVDRDYPLFAKPSLRLIG